MDDKKLSQAELVDEELDYVSGGCAKTGCPKCGNSTKIQHKASATAGLKSIRCLVCGTEFEGMLL